MTSSGWEHGAIGELALKVGSGATPRGGAAAYKPTGVPLIRSKNVVFFGFKREGLAYVDDEQASALKNVEVQAGDVLLNITGASIGRVSVAPEDMNGARVNQHVCIIRPEEGISSRFLAAYLSSPLVQAAIEAENYGMTRQALTKQQVLNMAVPVPPENEQRRIADKLDAVLARVGACRERLDRVPAIIKRFRQSVLAAATSGKLTEDWREEHGLGHWELVSLEEVATNFDYGSSKKSAKSGSVPVLRMGNIQGGRLDWSNLVFTSDATEIEKYRLQPGDILFNRTNSPELVGKTAVYGGEQEAIHAGYLIRVRCSDRLLPSFLNYSLNSPAGRQYCWDVKSDGVSQSNINAQKLRAFGFLLPSLAEQVEIIRRTESLISRTARIEDTCLAARASIERLTPAVLAKAFRGDIVPQEPNDEPASVLLERIRAKRAERPKKKAGRKARGRIAPRANRKGAAMTKSRQDEDVKGKPYLAGILREAGNGVQAEDLFRKADLPLADFYKQLAWEVANGHIRDDESRLGVA